MTTFYASIIAMALVLGVDAGGTASHAVLTTSDGAVRGRGTAGPGNACTQGSAAAAAIGTAVRAALDGHDPASVRATVVGVAGITGLSDPAVTESFARTWTELGLTCPVRYAGDAVTAFAAGTAAGTAFADIADAAFAAGTAAEAGTVLIAGTGAVAARVDGWEITATADGLGWLLGDEGSGTWLGLQAVRAAVRQSSPFAARVMAAAGVASSDALIHWAGRQHPSAFAALSPLVCSSDSPIAGQIRAEAVTRLVTTLDSLHAGGPVVVAGALLTEDTPIRAGVLGLLRARGCDAHIALDPALGAALLAARLASRAPTS